MLNPNFTEEGKRMISDEHTQIGRIFQALLDLNILYKSKHFDLLHLEHLIYVDVLKPYVDAKKAEFSFMESQQYKVYCKAKGIKLGKRGSAIPYLRETDVKSHGNWKWTKESPRFEFAELYFPIETAEDVAKDHV